MKPRAPFSALLLLTLMMAFMAAPAFAQAPSTFMFPFLSSNGGGTASLNQGFTLQWALFGGFGGTGGSALYYLALAAAFIGALLLIFNRNFQRFPIMASWGILVILMLFAPYNSKLLFYPINPRLGMECKQTAAALDSKGVCGFTPQLLAAQIGSVLYVLFRDLYDSQAMTDMVECGGAKAQLGTMNMTQPTDGTMYAQQHLQNWCPGSTPTPEHMQTGTMPGSTSGTIPFHKVVNDIIDGYAVDNGGAAMPAIALTANPMHLGIAADPSNPQYAQYLDGVNEIYHTFIDPNVSVIAADPAAQNPGSIKLTDAIENLRTRMPWGVNGGQFNSGDLGFFLTFLDSNGQVSTDQGSMDPTVEARLAFERDTKLRFDAGKNDNSLGKFLNLASNPAVKDMPVAMVQFERACLGTNLSSAPTVPQGTAATQRCQVRPEVFTDLDCNKMSALDSARMCNSAAQLTATAETGSSALPLLNYCNLIRDGDTAGSVADVCNKESYANDSWFGDVGFTGDAKKLCDAVASCPEGNDTAGAGYIMVQDNIMNANAVNNPTGSSINAEGGSMPVYLSAFAQNGAGQFAGWVAQQAVKIGSVFTGVTAMAFIVIMKNLIDLATVAIPVITPIFFIMGLLVPGHAPGLLFLSIMSMMVIKLVPVTWLSINFIASAVGEGLGSDEMSQALLMYGVASLYLSSVGLTLFIMFKIGDPGNLARMASLDNSAKQVADVGVNLAKVAATMTATLAGGTMLGAAGAAWKGKSVTEGMKAGAADSLPGFADAAARKTAKGMHAQEEERRHGTDEAKKPPLTPAEEAAANDSFLNDNGIGSQLYTDENGNTSPMLDYLNAHGLERDADTGVFMMTKDDGSTIPATEFMADNNPTFKTAQELSAAVNGTVTPAAIMGELNNLETDTRGSDPASNVEAFTIDDANGNARTFERNGTEWRLVSDDDEFTADPSEGHPNNLSAGTGVETGDMPGGTVDADKLARVARVSEERAIEAGFKNAADLRSRAEITPEGAVIAKTEDGKTYNFDTATTELQLLAADAAPPDTARTAAGGGAGGGGNNANAAAAGAGGGSTPPTTTKKRPDVSKEIVDGIATKAARQKADVNGDKQQTDLQIREKIDAALTGERTGADAWDNLPRWKRAMQGAAMGFVGSLKGTGGALSSIPIIGQAIGESLNEFHQAPQRARGAAARSGMRVDKDGNIEAGTGFVRGAYLRWLDEGRAAKGRFWSQEMAEMSASDNYLELNKAGAMQGQVNAARQAAREASAMTRSNYESMMARTQQNTGNFNLNAAQGMMSAESLRGIGTMQAVQRINSLKVEADNIQTNTVKTSEGGKVRYGVHMLDHVANATALKGFSNNIDQMMTTHYRIVEKRGREGSPYQLDREKTKNMTSAEKDRQFTANFNNEDIDADYRSTALKAIILDKINFMDMAGQFEELKGMYTENIVQKKQLGVTARTQLARMTNDQRDKAAKQLLDSGLMSQVEYDDPKERNAVMTRQVTSLPVNQSRLSVGGLHSNAMERGRRKVRVMTESAPFDYIAMQEEDEIAQRKMVRGLFASNKDISKRLLKTYSRKVMGQAPVEAGPAVEELTELLTNKLGGGKYAMEAMGVIKTYLDVNPKAMHILDGGTKQKPTFQYIIDTANIPDIQRAVSQRMTQTGETEVAQRLNQFFDDLKRTDGVFLEADPTDTRYKV